MSGFRIVRILLACIAAISAQLPTNVNLKPVFGTDAANKFTLPIWFGEIPGKAGNYLVVEQGAVNVDSARIYVLIPGTAGAYTKQKFLSLKVRQNTSEMGLLGFAFHPAFAQNRKYYICYNPPTIGSFDSTIIEERTATASLVLDAGSRRRILGVQILKTNHKAGTLGFGRDGYLYASLGDDGQDVSDLQNLMGVLLRINVDSPAGGLGYSIPADNPFVGNTTAGVRKEIWAYGLRNTWKWSFDPLNGNLWAGDVGESTAEEVDLVTKGGNFGWPVMEGAGCFSYNATKPNCNKQGLIPPVKDFTRDQAQCITGGLVYRGNPSSVFYGAYIFGDWQLKFIYALRQLNGVFQDITKIATAPTEISSFNFDSKGAIYAVGYTNGVLYLLDHTALVPVSIGGFNKDRRAGFRRPRLIPLLQEGGLDGGSLRSDDEFFSLDGTKAGCSGKYFQERALPRVGAGVYIAR